MATESQVRQNYAKPSGDGINKQINMELCAMYTYLSMVYMLCMGIIHCMLLAEAVLSSFTYTQSYYFDRDDVALPGFAKYFRKAAEEEKEHAEKFMKFQVQRGGRIMLSDIKKPAKDEWGSGLEAMQAALELEKSINQALLDLHKTANDNGDFQVRLSYYQILLS